MGYVLQDSTDSFLKKSIEKTLDHSREMVANDLNKGLESFTQDVLFLSHLPQVNEALQTRHSSNIKPEQWKGTRDSLQAIFTSMMKANPDYLQVRLIGLANQGLEWVRVDRKESKLLPTPDISLQTKGHHQYFQETFRKEKGEVYISKIELNRENNHISLPHSPVLRVSTPIYFNGEPKAIVIINIAAQNLIEKLEAHLGGDIYLFHLANDDHEVIRHSDPTKEFLFDQGLSHHIFHDLENFDDIADKVFTLKKPKEDNFYVKIGSLRQVFPDAPRDFFFLIGTDSGILDAFTSKSLKILAFMCLLFLLIQLTLVSNILSPISKIIDTLKRFGNEYSQLEPIPKPLHASLEINALIKAINNMGSALNLQNQKAIEEKEKRKKLMTELLQQRRAIDEHSIVAITDPRGRLTYVNKKFERVSGYKERELIGQTHNIVNSGTHSKSFFKNVWSTISQGSIWHGEICNRTKQGEIYWVLTTIFPFKDHHGDIEKYVAIRTDITHSKHNEEKLVSAMEKAQESNQAKSQFLSVVSHEMRTPLNAIIGFSDLLKTLPQEFPEDERKQFLELIHRNSKILSDLINNLLDLAKLESQKMELHLEAVDLKELFQTLDSTFSKVAGDKNVLININLEQSIPLLNIDRLKLNQVLMNLISNAIKFTPSGRSVSVQTQYTQGQLTFVVKDEGIGIPEDKQAQIFTPFTQVESSISRNYGGTGLGLSICRSLIDLMKGELKLESTLGVGSTFTVSIPVAQIEENVSVDVQEIDPTIFEGLSILIVEDNLVNLKLLKAILKQLPVKILQARDGEEGVEETFQNKPSLILMDLHMPKMDGFKATQIIRDNPETLHIPIIAVTADSGKEATDKTKAIGMYSLISKPIDKQTLFHTMAAAIRNSEYLKGGSTTA
jgi:PAS domain S-box-containing protein